MPTAVYVPKGMDHIDLTLDNIETLKRAQSGAPWVRKFGKLSI